MDDVIRLPDYLWGIETVIEVINDILIAYCFQTTYEELKPQDSRRCGIWQLKSFQTTYEELKLP